MKAMFFIFCSHNFELRACLGASDRTLGSHLTKHLAEERARIRDAVPAANGRVVGSKTTVTELLQASADRRVLDVDLLCQPSCNSEVAGKLH